MKYILMLLLALFVSPVYAQLDIEYLIDRGVKVNNASGVVIGQDKTSYYILTAGHVVLDEEDEQQFEEQTIRLQNSGFTVAVTGSDILASVDEWGDQLNNYLDLAVLKMPRWGKLGLKVMSLAKSDWHNKNEKRVPIYTIGAPKGSWLTTVKANARIHNGWIDVDPDLIPGRSGSAVTNMKGELIGIVSRSDGACVGVDTIRNWLKTHNKQPWYKALAL